MQGYEAHGQPGLMTESVCALLGQMFLGPRAQSMEIIQLTVWWNLGGVISCAQWTQ